MSGYQRLRLILGDQLNASHSWFRENNPQTLYVIAEMHQETHYCRHHIQKLCAFFAAMDAFARALQQAGHEVLHLTLDDTVDDPDFPALLSRLCRDYDIRELEYQQPDEYRLAQQLADGRLPDGVVRRVVDSEHFLLPFEEIPDYFRPGKAQKMEFFYRKLRRRFGILMDGPNGDEPRGGRWNFDSENRQSLRGSDLAEIPEPLCFSKPMKAVLNRLQRHDVQSIGNAADPLPWPISRQQSLALLRYFCDALLPNFGRYQDAMTGHSPHRWSLYHSRLSFAMNAKLLSPATVINAALRAHEARPEAINLAQVEGFIRQILGWREFVRGIYWANMPDYAEKNALGAHASLPNWYWDGNTRMRCLQQSITQSLEHAYAHHIQRLMVTGNFALMAGVNPDEVDAWYLGIYVDAIEWVELPNTRGMSQYADGGLLGSKAYAASANYLQKMSDYCGDCHYHPKEKIGERACPFNSLYWDFMLRHREKFSRNPRIGMVYKNWDKMETGRQRAILDQAHWNKGHLNEL
ncbi:cryptochrome/photolyase family protein [Spongiibacter tropicus]|uniref:cryptochrome/photolyase family protein n=1 Tax=Spongiibacter tropicus TaxID=454602 RepID=UPI003A99DC85